MLELCEVSKAVKGQITQTTKGKIIDFDARLYLLIILVLDFDAS